MAALTVQTARARAMIGALAAFASTAAAADPVDLWRPFIAEASARFDVPQTWIERVVRAESDGRTMLNGRPTTSRAGAMGLMQLMPATWAEMRIALRLGNDPHDPRDNILAGTAYLRTMYDRFGYPGLFAAYNAGPGRYAGHLATGHALRRETRAYLAAITGPGRSVSERAPKRSGGGIFVALGTVDRFTAATGETEPASLFVDLQPH